MELELNKEHISCYRPGTPIQITVEETAETVVPDYSPDIARIVDVSACLFLRSHSVGEGTLTASGAVRLTLLYLAEDAPGLRSLDYTMPFEETLGERVPADCGEVALEGRVCAPEVRLLNPRKLLTRLDIAWQATPYCREELTACGEIPDQGAYAIQTLCEGLDASLVTAVSEKDFVFSDELTIPGGREAIRDLLCSRVRLRVTESKSIGSKVVVKGVACVSLLYGTESGALCSYAEELPFSQLLDAVAQGEDEASVSTVLTLSGSEIHSAGDGERTVSVQLFLNAFVTVRSTREINCITDLYSTAYELEPELERIQLFRAPQTETVTESVREQLDTGTEVASVLSAEVCFGSISLRRNGSKTAVRAAALISALYLDEAGVPLKAERHIELNAEADMPDSAQVSVEEVCAGDVSANINAGGLELRFPVEFRLTCQEGVECPCLRALRVSEQQREREGATPLVLRALEEGQSLWDVAKQYRTTVEEIMAANELSDNGALEAGRLLLIPRKR